jgi:trans-aconitate methyltransferase
VNTSNSREWDANAYDRISAPQFSWGKKVLDRVSLRGDERILDAGCGTGKLTSELLANLPRGFVVGVDLSLNMLRTARQNLEPKFPRAIRFVAADLQHLPFPEFFDGIFSTAAFHWVPDHDLLFHMLFRSLRPGGWLIAQCGGAGNLDRLLARVARLAQTPQYAPYVGNYKYGWVYADPPTTAQRLEAAKFEDIKTDLELARARFEGEGPFTEFVSKVILHRFLEHLPDDKKRHAFLAEIAAEAAADEPPYELDYVRLNLAAHKPA